MLDQYKVPAKTGNLIFLNVHDVSRPTRAPNCLPLLMNPDAMLMFSKEFLYRHTAWTKADQKPELIFFLVPAEHGRAVTFTTADGNQTCVLLFGSKALADGYMRGSKYQGIVAACTLDSVPALSKQWSADGTTHFALNPCFRCGHANASAIAEAHSVDVFLQNWASDALVRRYCAQNILPSLGKPPISGDVKASRDLLEHMRDHLDCGNPYLHWLIGIYAAMQGDMDANAIAVQRLEEFGPSFKDKLISVRWETNTVAAFAKTMSEAMVGLWGSYGILNIPMNPAQPPE